MKWNEDRRQREEFMWRTTIAGGQTYIDDVASKEQAYVAELKVAVCMSVCVDPGAPLIIRTFGLISVYFCIFFLVQHAAQGGVMCRQHASTIA